MTQAEKDKIIKELQEKLAEAEKIKVNELKRWKPKYDETYWLVDYNGNICNATWYGEPDDEWAYLIGNCFETKEEAEEYKKQIEYIARYKNYIEEHSEPINWNNIKQLKYGAYYDLQENQIGMDEVYSFIDQGTIYASSEQVIWDAIKEIGEDNFKKYVLEVK